MRAVIKAPGRDPIEIDVRNELKELQRIVGGYIETVPVNGHMAIICNEEGKLQGLSPNIYYKGDLLVGTILFVGNGGEEFRDLYDFEVKTAKTLVTRGRLS